MTQEEKQLLIQDLCGRLPYSLKCCDFCYNDEGDIINTIETLECIYPSTIEYKYKDIDAKHDIEHIKPYLRTMSSMTEEEKKVFQAFHCVDGLHPYFYQQMCNLPNLENMFNWLNAHYFDYRELIEKGLALEAPKDMYNN